MDAGYDYLLLRPRLQQKFIRASAVFLLGTGAVLLSAGIAYFIYAHKARAGLDELNFALAAPVETQGPAAVQLPSLPDPVKVAAPIIPVPVVAMDLPIIETAPLVDLPAFIVEAAPPAETDSPVVSPPEPVGPLVPASAISAQRLYPANSIRASYWENPLEYEPASYVESSLIQGFRPVDSTMIAPTGTLASPVGLKIPSIAMDTEVEGLEILDLGDSRAYETPKHVVGHIPESSNPGEAGSVWLFGHLESPIAGEGNVFYNLPKIPDLLRRGEDVYTVVEAGGTDYLYQITEAFVVHADELRLDYGELQAIKPDYAHLDPGGANIHLVACVPRFVYDSRLVVSGQLVGVR